MQNFHKKHSKDELDENPQNNTGKKGVDKAPGEEQPQQNPQLMDKDLKGKKVDADPAEESDQPLEQNDNAQQVRKK